MSDELGLIEKWRILSQDMKALQTKYGASALTASVNIDRCADELDEATKDMPHDMFPAITHEVASQYGTNEYLHSSTCLRCRLRGAGK